MEYKEIYYQAPTTITVTALNTEATSGVIETESGYNYLIGIAFEYSTSAQVDLANTTELTRALTVDDIRVLPAGFDVKRLIAGAQVPLDKRFFPVCKEIKCNGSKIEVFLRTILGTIPGGGFRLKFYPILAKV
jgi:hypothetical protein